MQGVKPKHFSPNGHVESRPFPHGLVQVEAASSQLIPQKKDPLALHDVPA
jgi:hypothetical protein